MKRILFASVLILNLLTLPIIVNGVSPPEYTDWWQDVHPKIIAILSGIFGTLIVVMFVVAGILFLTAAGNPEQISRAKKAFLWGVIGLAVALIGTVIRAIAGQIFGF